MGIHTEISPSSLRSTATLNAALIRIVIIFYYQLNQNAYGTSMQTIKHWKHCWYLHFFVIFGILIDSEWKLMFHSYFERKNDKVLTLLWVLAMVLYASLCLEGLTSKMVSLGLRHSKNLLSHFGSWLFGRHYG